MKKLLLKKLSLIALLSIAIMGNSGESHAQETIKLVSQQKSFATIVTANKPSTTIATAAKVLSDHIFEISKARIPISTESQLKNARVANGKIVGDSESYILVGKSTFTQQLGVDFKNTKLDAIKLQTSGNVLALIGSDLSSDPDMTIYAVTTFLEEKLDVRYLWPGELGKVIPHRDEISIAPFSSEYSPSIKQRHIRHSDAVSPRHEVGLQQLGATNEDYISLHKAAQQTQAFSPDWYVWQKLGDTHLVTGHAYGYIWDKYGKEHPDWFAMQPNGSRDQSASPSRARLCVSNLALQAAIARDKIEELDRNPNQHSVSIDPNDGGGTTFCMCPECQKLDAPGGAPIRLVDNTGKEKKYIDYVSLTDRMIYFWNGIAERVEKVHPEALLTVRAYSTYSSPPLIRKLRPNIVVEQVSGSYFNPDRVQRFLTEWTEWSASTQKLAWRPNIDANQRRHGLPTVYVHKMAEDFRARAHSGMISTDIDSMHKGWAINGLNLYVLARLHWRPDLNVDDVIDDYCQTGFGAGASAMKKYFLYIEKAESTITEDNRSVISTEMAKRFDAPSIKVLRGYLGEAQKATSDDSTIQQRIDFVRQGLDFAEVQAQAFELRQEIAKTGKAGKEAAIENLMTKRYSLMKSIFRKHTLAIDIAYLLWGSEAGFRSLQTTKTKALLATPTNVKTVIDADEFGAPEEQETIGQ